MFFWFLGSDKSRGVLAGGAICLSLAVAVGSAVATAGVFDGLAGSWTGAGQITLDGGVKESLKCKAYYTDKSERLGIALRCASASYKIDLRANLASSGSSLSGDWEERQFNAAGKVSGEMSGNRLNLAINGGGVSGSLAVTTNGASQTVSLATEGSTLKGVSIGLSRD